jgi:hypothetical protein
MTRDGQTRLLYDTIDGQPIGKVNFVLRDSQKRIWMTISTRIKNLMQAVSHTIADGYIALADDKGLRIVADGFKFTNEIRLDDTNEDAALALEKAFVEDRTTPEDMLAAGGTLAPWFASVTFGGPDLKTAYIGSLRGTRIPYFQPPVAGLPMVHWK